MTKWAHLLALVNALLGLVVLLGWVDLSVDEIAAIMGALGLVGAFFGAFFDKNVPWFGPGGGGA